MAKNKTKILLLEDDTNLREIISEFLEEEGFLVESFENAQIAADRAYEGGFDLLLLDVMVPRGNGFTLLKEIRARNDNVSAIFITALNQLSSVEQGFLAGADDYLRKPFELKELKMRIDAVLKRRYGAEVLELGGGLKFISKTESLERDGVAVALPQKERKLLALLLQNLGRFVSTEAINSTLWEYDEEPSEQALRVYVKNLRKVVGAERIITRRGEGYCFVDLASK